MMTEVELKGGPQDGAKMMIGTGIEEILIPSVHAPSCEHGTPLPFTPSRSQHIYKRLRPDLFGYIKEELV